MDLDRIPVLPPCSTSSLYAGAPAVPMPTFVPSSVIIELPTTVAAVNFAILFIVPFTVPFPGIPMGPVNPIGPIGPVAPVSPIDPVSPTAPVAPVSPVGP